MLLVLLVLLSVIITSSRDIPRLFSLSSRLFDDAKEVVAGGGVHIDSTLLGIFHVCVSLCNPAEASNNQKPNQISRINLPFLLPFLLLLLLLVPLLNCLITNSLARYFLLFWAEGAAAATTTAPHTGRVITGSFVLAVAHQM